MKSIAVENLSKSALIAFTGVIFLVAAFFVMSNGHLHEDAYILFQYSRNLATGKGIVFDSSSGRMEGATDFLWMILLSVFSKITNMGAAAAILNATGIMSIAYVILRLRGGIDLISISAIFAVIFSGGFSAAIGGFSTLAYGGLYAALTLFAIQRNYPITAILAILISLFRPDGAILAFGTLVAFISFSKKEEWKKSVIMVSAVMAIGFAYFYWRWDYFNAILPLPLLVKMKSDSLLDGLTPNLLAVEKYSILFIPALFYWSKISPENLLKISLGPIILFAALSFAYQSQNIGFRFQYVIVLAIIFIYVTVTPKLKGSLYFLAALPLLGIMQGARIIKNDIDYLTRDDYINNFPQLLRKADFKVDNIAITEAGRFPFWLDARKMTDLVGLNSRGVVQYGPAYMLRTQTPKLVFVHQAGRYNLDRLNNRLGKNAYIFLVTTPDQISLNAYYGTNPIWIAPAAALEYAKKNDFIAILVKYGRNDLYKYSHVYFLSKDLDITTFIKQLTISFTKKSTYFSSCNDTIDIC